MTTPWKIIPRVIDIYSGDDVSSFDDIAADGIWGVIHKATQGQGFTDKRYAGRRPQAEAAGLLWGAYHFGTSAPARAQADHFWDTARPDENTLLALDFEENGLNKDDSIDFDIAREFLEIIDAKVGKPIWVYSGNYLKEALDGTADDFWSSHPLWLAQYSKAPVCPPGWERPHLWQYTGDGIGPEPHEINGAQPKLDINHWGGTLDQLKAVWR